MAMTELPFSSPQEQTVVIVGVGLIGGSLAAALKSRQAAGCVIGVGRDFDRIDAARKAGLIDEAVTDAVSVLHRADVVVFCTPVDRIADEVRKLMAACPTSTAVGPSKSLLLTDAGSVKNPVCSDLDDVPNFIGSHPIAGSHQKGFEAADAQLFADRVCVVTPVKSSPEPQVARLERFWKAVGMRTVRMSPIAHDQSLALTSHLPHVVAAALSRTLSDENRLFTGSGFRDTTRVASGDPDLWTGILMSNSEHILSGIDAFQQGLAAYRNALATRDAAEIRRLLLIGQQSRMALDEKRK
jgi:prephenate dehydrogenase